VTASPRDIIAEAIVSTKDGRHITLRGRKLIAQHALDGLEAAGYTVVPAAEYEELLEIRAGAEGRFPRCFIVKVAPDTDLYVGWSDVVEAPVGMWTRAEALGDGCPESRLRRADETGTSAHPGFYDWNSGGMIAEQRGYLPRARLEAYVRAYMDGRMEDCWDLLEPFDDAIEVRRG
jgi:hypothetical protein